MPWRLYCLNDNSSLTIAKTIRRNITFLFELIDLEDYELQEENFKDEGRRKRKKIQTGKRI